MTTAIPGTILTSTKSGTGIQHQIATTFNGAITTAGEGGTGLGITAAPHQIINTAPHQVAGTSIGGTILSVTRRGHGQDA